MNQGLQDKISSFRQNSFVQNVAFLQSASVIGNFIQALAGVFIARILQPELFGVYTLAFSLAGLFFISTGIQETLIVILGRTYTQQNREETVNALVFLLKFSITFALITVIVSLFLPAVTAHFYHNSRIGVYAGLAVAAAIFSSTALSMSTMILQVTGNIKAMSKLIVVDQIVRFSLSLALVFLGYGVFGAMLGHLIGAAGIFLLARLIWIKQVEKYQIFPSWQELFSKLRSTDTRKHLGFSIWAAIDKNIAGLYGLLPILLVGIFLSKSEVAYFKLAIGYIGLALTLLIPISTLLNFELSKMRVQEPEKMGRNFIRISLYSVLVSTVLTIGAIVTAPFVFRILYGESFLPSANYVAYFLVYGALFGVGVGLGPMWRTLNKVKISILINTIVLAVGLPLGLFLIKNYHLGGAITMVTILYTGSHFASFFYLAKYFRKR